MRPGWMAVALRCNSSSCPLWVAYGTKCGEGKQGVGECCKLLSDHCNVGGYLGSVKKQESGSCGYCGLEEEDVHHYYLLRCPRWYMQRLEMDDLIVRGDPRSSLGNMFRELERLARYVKQTRRLS